VIGVMEKRGSEGFENQDNLVVVPLAAAQKILFGINYINSAIAMKVADQTQIDFVVEQVKDIMREQHNINDSGKDDFTVYTTASFLDTLENITNALKLFLSMIAAVSLVVGGVGIMNIMLVAVNERTREIGLRKAIGATSENVQWQFLIESVVLTLLGGVVGVLIGVAVSGLIALIAGALGYAWQFVVTIPSIILGVGVAGCVGIIFGYYPAKKASDLEPIEALRYE